MQFGKVEDEIDLSSIDFKLPPDHRSNNAILSSAAAKSFEVFVGCAKWGRPDWVGKLYPPKTKQADFLNHYARHFNCIELNATFYRMPTKAQIKSWKSKVGSDFKFCPKFTDQITHIKRLKPEAKELVDRFLEAIYEFKENLGPLFLMPHPQMGPKSLDIQQAFIESLPQDIELFVEQRHKDFYANTEAFDKWFEVMHKNKSGAVITDASGRRDCVHMRLSTPEVFIRFVGNGLHPTDYTRIDDWVERMGQWKDKGIQKIYFFMHQHEELHSPELCRYLIPKMNQRLGTNIPTITFINE